MLAAEVVVQVRIMERVIAVVSAVSVVAEMVKMGLTELHQIKAMGQVVLRVLQTQGVGVGGVIKADQA